MLIEYKTNISSRIPLEIIKLEQRTKIQSVVLIKSVLVYFDHIQLVFLLNYKENKIEVKEIFKLNLNKDKTPKYCKLIENNILLLISSYTCTEGLSKNIIEKIKINEENLEFISSETINSHYIDFKLFDNYLYMLKYDSKIIKVSINLNSDSLNIITNLEETDLIFNLEKSLDNKFFNMPILIDNLYYFSECCENEFFKIKIEKSQIIFNKNNNRELIMSNDINMENIKFINYIQDQNIINFYTTNSIIRQNLNDFKCQTIDNNYKNLQNIYNLGTENIIYNDDKLFIEYY